MRIQKYLSQMGLLSRREAEAAIEKGRVFVNNQPARIGQVIDPDQDHVTLDPELTTKSPQVLMLNKPRGIITNCPQENETEIKDILPEKYRHFSCIGRLDKDSEGLILLTDSGIVAQKALRHTHPHPREYLVWVHEPLPSDLEDTFLNGIELEGRLTKPVTVKILGEKYCKLRLFEGKNRQIRRMMFHLGLHVVRLKRITFGGLKLDDLNKGEYRLLSPLEIDSLIF